jgi:hypothetical protein
LTPNASVAVAPGKVTSIVVKVLPLRRKPCWWLLASKKEPATSPESLMPCASVMLGAKGSSIVLKILMGMLSPPHRRRALAVGSPRRDREAAIIRTASKASEGCGQREESLSPQGEL